LLTSTAVLALLGGCGPSHAPSEWAGQYTYSSIGSNWTADKAVKTGYVQIEKDGSFVAVNLPQDWRDSDEGAVFRGRFVLEDTPENWWPLSYLGNWVEIVGDRNQRGPTIITITRKTKSISFNRGLEGSWIRYEAPR